MRRIEQVTCTATGPGWGRNSSRSRRKVQMNSAGSYNLMRPIFSRMRCRQGLWSHSTGQRPSSLARHSASSSSAVLRSAMSAMPLLSQIVPQQRRSIFSGKITS